MASLYSWTHRSSRSWQLCVCKDIHFGVKENQAWFLITDCKLGQVPYTFWGWVLSFLKWMQFSRNPTVDLMKIIIEYCIEDTFSSLLVCIFKVNSIRDRMPLESEQNSHLRFAVSITTSCWVTKEASASGIEIPHCHLLAHLWTLSTNKALLSRATSSLIFFPVNKENV